MREHPIIFNTEMVKAILEGRKTQTRRVISNRKDIEALDFMSGQADETQGNSEDLMFSWGEGGLYFCSREYPEEGGCFLKPKYGQVGDGLWVRETWCEVNDTEFGGKVWIDYKATPKYSASHPAGWENAPKDLMALKWKSPRFMPKIFSRITLEITDVKVERLQEISTSECPKEGVQVRPFDDNEDMRYWKSAFSILWNSIHKKEHRWEDNPWVWVISFKRIT